MNTDGIPDESASPSMLRGMHITLSPGEEYENYQKVNAATRKTETLNPFGYTPSQENDDDEENQNDDQHKLENVAEETAEELKRKESIANSGGVSTAATMGTGPPSAAAIPPTHRLHNKLPAKERLHRLKSVSGHTNVVLHVSRMVNPLGRFRLTWDVISIGFIFYNAFALPVGVDSVCAPVAVI